MGAAESEWALSVARERGHTVVSCRCGSGVSSRLSSPYLMLEVTVNGLTLRLLMLFRERVSLEAAKTK